MNNKNTQFFNIENTLVLRYINMFSILNNDYQLNLSAHKVKNILDISCYKKINEIETDLKNISKSIQMNNGMKLPLLKSLLSENDYKYYSAIFVRHTRLYHQAKRGRESYRSS